MNFQWIGCRLSKYEFACWYLQCSIIVSILSFSLSLSVRRLKYNNTMSDSNGTETWNYLKSKQRHSASTRNTTRFICQLHANRYCTQENPSHIRVLISFVRSCSKSLVQWNVAECVRHSWNHVTNVISHWRDGWQFKYLHRNDIVCTVRSFFRYIHLRFTLNKNLIYIGSLGKTIRVGTTGGISATVIWYDWI